MRRIIIIILISFALSGIAIAQDAGNESPFSIGAGARSLGMGGGFISLADDPSTIYYNPAGLAWFNYQQASLMHIDLFEGTIYDFVGYVYPHENYGGFAAGYFRVGTDDIIKRSDYINEGTFDYTNSQIVLSYGRKLSENMSVGINAKAVNQSLDNYSDYGFGIDFGLYGKIGRQLYTGFVIRDMMPADIKLNNLSESSPITIAGGLALKELFINDDLKLTASFELEKIEKRSVKVHTGGELVFNERYAIRSGYDKDNLVFGLGLNVERFKFDYAYKIMDLIDNSHRFSLSIMIGSSLEEKQIQSRVIAQQRDTVLITGEKQRLFERYSNRADDYYSRRILDSALSNYHRALAFDEDNQHVNDRIEEIEDVFESQRKVQIVGISEEQELQNALNNYLTQAELFADKKYYNAAQDMLNLIFDIRPEFPEAIKLSNAIHDSVLSEIRTNLTQAKKYENENNLVKALKAYNRILELSPKNIIASDALEKMAARMDLATHLNRGINFYNNKNYNRSKSAFLDVLTLDRQNPVALEYLKKIAQSEAQPTTLEELQRDKKIWKLYLEGLRLMRDKQYKEAIDAWNKVLKVYPNNLDTINNIEQAQLRMRSSEG